MRVINHLNQIPKEEKIILTIGNFDGIHSGHQSLISSVQEKAKRINSKFVLISFWPHPKQVLSPKKKGFLLNTREEKIKRADALGIDYFFEINFDRDFSTQTPNEFLDSYIFKHEGIQEIFLGYDFSFGANKEGGFDLAYSRGKEFNIKVNQLKALKVDEKIVSSSLIRQSLALGEVEEAARLLGYPYRLSGRIIKGQGRGKKIGFATANIELHPFKLLMKKGVYITKSKINKSVYHSVTNIGKNPTFGDIDQLQIETHLLGFDRDIYGEKLEVEFLKRLRDEVSFSSVNELLDQINLDVQKAKSYFKSE